jgi:DNA-directed RNA polymerase subunit alpha
MILIFYSLPRVNWRIEASPSSFEHDSSVFLHCIDSRLEEDGSWYSRFNIGPFKTGSRLQIGTRIRRSLIDDLIQTCIIAIELEGVIHEFSRIPGLSEPVLDLLLRFRKLILYSPTLAFSERIVVPFFFLGPGNFYAKDVIWPDGVQCRNPKDLLVHLSPGAVFSGRFLIQTNVVLGSVVKRDHFFFFDVSMWSQYFGKRCPKHSKYPWLSLGFPTGPVDRVGFRIESIETFNKKSEVLILEIVTNGSLSPRQALSQSTLALIHKFSAIASATLPSYTRKHSINIKFRKKFSSAFIQNQKVFDQASFCCFFGIRFFNYPTLLNLDLGNLELSKNRYNEFQNLGFQTLGQLLEGLTSNFYSFPYILKKQRKQALICFGISPYSDFL